MIDCFANMCKKRRKWLVNRTEVTVSHKLVMEVYLHDITFAALLVTNKSLGRLHFERDNYSKKGLPGGQAHEGPPYESAQQGYSKTHVLNE